MKMHNVLLLVLVYVLTISMGCGNNQGKNSTVQPDTIKYSNITILLDLSNRVDSNKKEQILRDTSLISAIVRSFDEDVKRHGYIYSQDRVQLLIAPQAGNQPINFNPHIDIQDIVKKNPNKVIRQLLPDLENDFLQQVANIYSSNQKFSGADIWSFFKNTPEQELIKTSFEEKANDGSVYYQFRNKLIIFTDGYLNFDSKIQQLRETNNTAMQVSKLRNDKNWESSFSRYKLTPLTGKKYNDLGIMLVEINPVHPEQYTNEYDIIKKYWQQWFGDMNINNIAFHQSSESIPLIVSSVNNFINSN